MDEFVCLTVVGKPSESASAFTSRLYAFWTHMLRNQPDDYEKVYAEAVEFEQDGERMTRQYMIQPDVADLLRTELAKHAIEFRPIDEDDLYSKAEASTNEWFQLEH